MLVIQISINYVPKRLMDNPALVQISAPMLAWYTDAYARHSDSTQVSVTESKYLIKGMFHYLINRVSLVNVSDII